MVIVASEVLLDVDQDARHLAEADPAEVLKGPPPRLIDEWQLEPGIWNHVRRSVDDRRAPGHRFLGLLVESMVVRDLRVNAQAADAEVFHYRENGRLARAGGRCRGPGPRRPLGRLSR